MAKMKDDLALPRCPHCRIDTPNLQRRGGVFGTNNHEGSSCGYWSIYTCRRCGNVILAHAPADGQNVDRTYPANPTALDVSIPERAREFLKQALDTIHSASASVVVSAAAVDAMLKTKGYEEGSLYDRINSAKTAHQITEEMAAWAHEVRLDANEQRHADKDAELPTQKDAKRCIDFALALGEFWFAIPARVQRGREEVKAELEKGESEETPEEKASS